MLATSNILRCRNQIISKNIIQSLTHYNSLKTLPSSRSVIIRHFTNSPCTKFTTSKSLRNEKSSNKEEISNISSTKASILAQTNSKLQRLWLSVKWPLIRDGKTSKWDVSSAFISTMIMGNLLWILLGTTTFGLVVMYSLHYLDNIFSNSDSKEEQKHKNSVFGYIASSILSNGLGFKLQFEKGVLPEFKDGKLRFNNFKLISKDNSQLDVIANVETMDLTLSFNKWYEGKGLIYDMDIFGLNAKIVKKSNIENDMVDIDKNYLFEHIKIRDSFLEIYEANSDEPTTINIFSCDLPRLRGDQLVIDFLNANNASGAINNSLFTIHKRQSLDPQSEPDDKLIRFKLDTIDLGKVSKANPKSKFNWIVNGKAEVIADITLPKDEENNESISEVITKLFNNISNMNKPSEKSNEDSLLKDAINAIYQTFKSSESEDKLPNESYVMVNVKVKFSDLQASLPQNLPLSSNQLPFISLSDLRTIIGFINHEKNPITLKTTIIEKISNLYNIEHLGQTKMFDSIIADMYEELTGMVKEDEKRIVSSQTWTKTIATQLILIGLGALA
ncbi:MDM32 [Candida pseudojiufengensis]|uniref:MDM32 n=1 Tax=Candida pseudojiufengensis TaxID=497109 RepID=UPI002224F4CA|nr:MDM32 [Candida pseudojiufengensis]KAI5961868.1 MDM32 [Candida pseudojiufengensis]